jgi:hypothetical protein
MALDAKFNAFKDKYNLGDEAMAEMLSIFNDSFIDLAHKLLQSEEIKAPRQTKSVNITKSKSISNKKWATKIAAEYAAENELTLDNFDKEKITKKDIDEYIKNHKESPAKSIKKLDTTVVKKETNVKHKCCGLTKSGEPCNRPGTEQPEGSKKHFCFRHSMDWKIYEVSSDSDLEEDEPDLFGDKLICKEIEIENEEADIFKDLAEEE